MRRRLLVPVAVSAAFLVASQAASPGASRIRFRANLFAETHTPRAGAVWNYTIKVTNLKGDPIKVVAKQWVFHNGHRIDTVGWNQFRGTYRHSYRWPTVDRGKSLQFVVRVVGPGGARVLTYAVRVR
jgi:hypothetical protein